MNVLFVSPHFPPQFVHFCLALKELGVRVLGVGDVPWEGLTDALRAGLDGWAHVPQMEREADVVEAVRGLVTKYGALDRVESLNEHWLPLEARLREVFDVPGPRPAEVLRWRSKSAMRATFQGAGVPCTEGEPVERPSQVRAFAKRHGYPLVIKPDTGVGAQRTFKVSMRRELDEALREPLRGFVVERFEPGQLESWDGFVDRDGRVVFHVAHTFSAGVMEIVNERRTPWYRTRREVPWALEALGQRAVAAFGLRDRFFHLECFANGGEYRALELNVRPAGGFTTDMLNWACDTDVYRLWARALAGQDVSGFAYERRYGVAHVGRRREVSYRVPHEALVAELGPALMAHRTLPEPVARAMGDDVYLLREADEARLERLVAMVSAS